MHLSMQSPTTPLPGQGGGGFVNYEVRSPGAILFDKPLANDSWTQ